MTSSVKPEVHNLSQRRHRKADPRPQVNMYSYLVNMKYVVLEIYKPKKQRDRKTDTINTMLPYRSLRSGVIGFVKGLRIYPQNALTPRTAVGKFTLLSKSDLRC